MLENRHETEIDGTAAQVWTALITFTRYHEWNPVIHEVAGVLATGERIEITVAGQCR